MIDQHVPRLPSVGLTAHLSAFLSRERAPPAGPIANLPSALTWSSGSLLRDSVSRIHRGRAGKAEEETERVGGWMSLRAAPLNCLLFRPSETVQSGPSHRIKASLWEAINSSLVPPKGWWVHFRTRLLHEELSVTAHPGAGPNPFLIHSQVCVLVLKAAARPHRFSIGVR